jgi:HPt (histidine-containing phosphotransfer) domain-containing protein
MKTKKLYDLEQLIEIVGEEEGLLKMLTIFIESTPRNLEELNENFRNKNFAMIAHNAHKMKASIDMMKVVSLHDVIRKIDKLDKVIENQAELSGIISVLNTTLSQVFAELKKEFAL